MLPQLLCVVFVLFLVLFSVFCRYLSERENGRDYLSTSYKQRKRQKWTKVLDVMSFVCHSGKHTCRLLPEL
jgi:hypothetical protein